MAYTTVDTAIMKFFDRFAKIKEGYVGVVAASDNSFWDIIDASEDETFENRVKGSDVTVLDTKFTGATIGSFCGTVLNEFRTYFTKDLGYTSPGWAGYLAAKHRRVPEYFADVYYEVYASRLTARYIAASQEKTGNILGTLAIGGTGANLTYLSTNLGNTRLGAVVTTLIGSGTNMTIDFTARNTAAETAAYTSFAVTQASAAGTVFPIGAVTPTNYTHGATTVITMGSTTGFKASGYALVVNSTYAAETPATIMEYVPITAVTADTSITVSLLTHTATGEFTQLNAPNTRVYPMFNGVTALALSSGSQPASGAIKIVPLNDRTPAL